MFKILYREVQGAGDDNEAANPNGIVVTLSFWQSDDFLATSHYLTESKVMIDRQIVVDEAECVRTAYSDAKFIRKAIARFDQLKELSPEVLSNSEFDARRYAGAVS